jgi:GMP synthase-like glutamine amidotransferase
MKVALLQSDNVMEKLQPEFGSYSGMVRSMFDGVDVELEFEIFDCQQGQYPDDIQRYDFYVTTGSKASAFDDEDWIRELVTFVKRLDENQKKLIGICFGHQIIALARGGEVERSNKGWGVGIANNRIVTQPEWMSGTSVKLDMLVSHRDQISDLPSDTQIIAQSDFCPYFVVQWGDHFLSIQGHPEWKPEYSRALMNERRGLIPDDRIDVGMQSLHQAPDGPLFVDWILDFVRH